MGEDLLFSVPIIIALVVRFYVEQIRRVVLNYRDAAGLWIYDKWKPILGCLVNVVLNIILVRYFGVIGVAISTIVDFAIIELPWETRTLFKQYFKKSPVHYYKLLAVISILTVFNGAITYWICGYLGIEGVVVFLGRLLVCFLVTNILFYFELRMIPEFKLSIDLVKKSLGSFLK
ncbi:MAG: hypothetical protein MSA18_02925 [Succinivibrio sp.]|nr:hypothetical protein [Succinivibrio sp.]